MHFKKELFFLLKLFNHLPINIKYISKEIKLSNVAYRDFFFYIHFIQ